MGELVVSGRVTGERHVLVHTTGGVYHLPRAAGACSALLALESRGVELLRVPLAAARSRGLRLCAHCEDVALQEPGPALEPVAGPRVTITYCTQCQWLLRAGWMAQELLTTFSRELGEVSLVPGTGGVFTVAVGDVVVWDRKAEGGFPDVTTLKQRVRDEAAPERHLGHADRRREGDPRGGQEPAGQDGSPGSGASTS